MFVSNPVKYFYCMLSIKYLFLFVSISSHLREELESGGLFVVENLQTCVGVDLAGNKMEFLSFERARSSDEMNDKLKEGIKIL